jgi:hypothetical protein
MLKFTLNPETLRNWLSVAGLALLTLSVAVVYAVEPQGPRDALDRAALALDENAYGPNLRAGERLMARALEAEAAAADTLADGLELRAARAFGRASAAAPGPREEMLANDRAADAYLAMGRRHLERGRGSGYGIGRHAGELGAAERAALCLVGLSPTRRRSQINAFVEELEAVLDRPLAGSCPQ